MDYKADDIGVLIHHHQDKSWCTKLSENKGALVFFAILIGYFFLCGSIAKIFASQINTISRSVIHTFGVAWFVPVCFVVGLIFGLCMLLLVRFIDRGILGKKKNRVAVIDNQMITECWVSTDKYHKRWKYQLVWLFETRGLLTLSPRSLDFQSKVFDFQCYPSRIKSIELKRHPLWLKPIPLKFISVTMELNDGLHTFNITPSIGQTDTVWECNAMVAKWAERLEKARQKC